MENSIADLLSRVPHSMEQTDDFSLNHPDISSKNYEIGTLNSIRFDPKDYARCKPQFSDKVTKPTYKESLNMVAEQDKDEVILKLKRDLNNDTLSPTISKKYVLLVNVMYYISKSDSDPCLRLCISNQLQDVIITEYNSTLGHLSIDKIHGAIHAKYY